MDKQQFREDSELQAAVDAMINESNSSEDLDEAIDYSRKISNVKSQMSKGSRQKENPQGYVEKEMMELEDALNNFHYSVIGTRMKNIDSRMKIDLRHIEKKIEEIIELTSNWTV